MFSFTEKVLKRCGNGCQLLWSDPNKQASGYDSVKREDGDADFLEEDNFEGTLENDPLTGAIIMSQPSASARTPVWAENKHPSPIVKNSSSARGFSSVPLKATGRSASLTLDSAMSTPIVKNGPVVKKSSVARSTSQQSINNTAKLKSSKSRSVSAISVHSSDQTRQLSKKQKSEEVKMQIVSTV